MSGALKLQFVIEAVDNATKTLRTVNAAVDRTNAPMRRVRESVGALLQEAGWGRLQAQFGKINERAQALGQTVRGIGYAFGAMNLAVAGAFFTVKRTIDEVAGVADAAEKLGMSTEALSRLQFAAEQSGSSAEEMATALRFLSDNMVAARNGSKEAQASFGMLGISMAQLKKMQPADVIGKMAEVFEEVGNVGQNAQLKIALSQNLMGRAGSQMIQTLNGGRKALSEFGTESDRLGYTINGATATGMKEFNDTFERLRASLRGVMVEIAKAALPAFDSLVKKFTELNVANRAAWGERFGRMLGQIIEALPSFLTGVGQIGSGMATVIELADKVAQAMGGWQNVIYAIGAIMGAVLTAKIVALGMAIGQALPMIWSLVTVVGNVALGFAAAVGWPALLAAGLVAAAVLIYKYWEPIKQFFSELLGTIGRVSGAVGRGVAGFFGFDQAPGLAPAATAVPSALPAGGKAQLDGQIRIFVDSEGRARVTDLSTKQSGPLKVDMAYNGPGMAFPL